MKEWGGGLGIEKINVDVETDVMSFWDSEVDTRFPGQITLGAKPVHCTITPAVSLRHHFVYDDELYFTVATQGPLTYIGYKFSTPATVGSNKIILGIGSNTEWQTSPIGGALGIGKFLVFTCQPSYELSYGLQICSVATLGADKPRKNVSAKAQAYSDTPMYYTSRWLHFAGLSDNDVVSYQKQIFTNGVFGGALSTGSLSTQAIPTNMQPLVSDGLRVFSALPEGVVDMFPTGGCTTVVDTARRPDKNILSDIFGGDLIVKHFEDLIAVDISNLTPEAIGLNMNDGLPEDKTGNITAMTSSWKYLFAAVKGATYSNIFAYDGAGWHFLSKIPSAGAQVRDMFITSVPDDITRLWLMYLSGNPNYILNPLTNPVQAGTYNYAPTGHITFPIYDGGMVEEPGAFYDMAVNVDSIGGGNKLDVYYGLNGASPVTTLGAVGSIVTKLQFGAGVGVDGYRIQPKFLFTGSPAGTTPIFREANIHYLKLPKERESFTFTVDLKETAMRETRPLEAILGSLSYEKSCRTLLPFWYGRMATKNVKVLEMPSLEEIDTGNIYEDERIGLVTVRVAELI